MHAHVVGKPIAKPANRVARPVRLPERLSLRASVIAIFGLTALLWSGIWALVTHLV